MPQQLFYLCILCTSSPYVEFLECRPEGRLLHICTSLLTLKPSCHALVLPRRVVLTAALSNELWNNLPASMASSPIWWRRWGHAEVALYPHKPTQVSRLLILTGNFSTVGSGEACQGQLHIVPLGEKNNLFFKGREWKYLGRHVGMCSQYKESYMIEFVRSVNSTYCSRETDAD